LLEQFITYHKPVKIMVFSKREGGRLTQFCQGAGQSPCLSNNLGDATEEINGMGSGDSTQFCNSTILLPEYKDWVKEYLGF
jgi:hypothetical protein